jgi:proline dehydrogenase
MFGGASRALFHALARSKSLKTLASRIGMRPHHAFASRFIAGETIAEAIAHVRAVEARGFMHTLDHLGESVKTGAEADQATREYLDIMDAAVSAGIGRNVSLKLTQLGLDVDRATAVDNLRRVLHRADRDDFFVRIDMENSPYTAVTLDIFETLWRLDYRRFGVVLQAALHRSEADLRRILALGARVRLVKGAYDEPKTVAYQRKADVDAAYARMMKVLLVEGNYPAIATHDGVMIRLANQFASQNGIGPQQYEFQMLYGVRRDLQAKLLADGFRVRVYIPFGREWFPYFMRRLGERPANVGFIVRSLLRDQG